MKSPVNSPNFWRWFAILVLLFIIAFALISIKINRYQVRSYDDGVYYSRYDKFTGQIQYFLFKNRRGGWISIKKPLVVRPEDVEPVNATHSDS